MKRAAVSCLLATLLAQLPVSLSMDLKNGAGEIIRGLPCVKRLNQLFCPTAGTSYPSTPIDKFIDDNKALMRRMYGELQETTTLTTVRVVRTYGGVNSGGAGRFSYSVSAPLTQTVVNTPGFARRDVLEGTLEEMMAVVEQQEEVEEEGTNSANNTARARRQADFPGAVDPTGSSAKVDVCESKVEIVTPFWGTNSNGKVRAILNNKEFEQAIHQEICSVTSTPRCTRDCSCEQKFKWHRLLAYDPNNECAGIFMDWFLYPSCCVCRCNKNPFLTK